MSVHIEKSGPVTTVVLHRHDGGIAEFVDFLRAKAVAGPAARTPARVVKLGGLWKGHTFSEEDINEARSEVWSALGREPS